MRRLSHVNKRAQQRYGVAVNARQKQQMTHQITSGKATFVRHKGNLASVYLCRLPNGERCLAVYHKRFKKIVTILPNVALENDAQM